MNNTYLNALKDSLEKKLEVLKDIHSKDEIQYSLTKEVPFPYEAFDKIVEEKTVLIYKLDKLDEGFELVYNNVKNELSANKEMYKTEIKEMQELIKKVTDLNVQIQAEEARNKNAMEAAFRDEKSRLKSNRSGVKAVKSYTQTMRAGSSYSGIWDEKK